VLRTCEHYSGSEHDQEVMPAALVSLAMLCFHPGNKVRILAQAGTPKLFALLTTHPCTPLLGVDKVSAARQTQFWTFLGNLAQFPESQQILTDGLAFFLQPGCTNTTAREAVMLKGEAEHVKVVEAMITFGIPRIITSVTVLLDMALPHILTALFKCCAAICFCNVGFEALSASGTTGSIATLFRSSLLADCPVGVVANSQLLHRCLLLTLSLLFALRCKCSEPP
jgi:hypothetical protein